jgi:rubrerythrin
MVIEELVKEIQTTQVSELENELTVLFNRELFERTYYFKQLQKFDGKIFDIIKWLMSEEEKHVHILKMILAQANINLSEELQNIPNVPKDQIDVIKRDIEFEEFTTKEYNDVLEKLEPLVEKSNGALKNILIHIRDEELYHIEILKQYLKENK